MRPTEQHNVHGDGDARHRMTEKNWIESVTDTMLAEIQEEATTATKV